MNGLVLGAIVHYVPIPSDNFHDDAPLRAAVVVRIWSDTCCNLQVLATGIDDLPHGGSMLSKSSVVHGLKPVTPNTWHFVGEFDHVEVDQPSA